MMSSSIPKEGSANGGQVNSVFNMSQLDIPNYSGGGNSAENSVHTTPLNYMRRTTPMSAVRRIEQIRERDPYTGLGEDNEKIIDAQLDRIHISSTGASDEFFQLQSQNEHELEELEPSTGELPRQPRANDPYFAPSEDTNHRYNAHNDLSNSADQFLRDEGYGGYGSAYDQQDQLLHQHDGPGSLLQSTNSHTSSYLVVPPSGSNNSGYPENAEYAANSAIYGQQQQPPQHQQRSNYGSMLTPRESWTGAAPNRGILPGQAATSQYSAPAPGNSYANPTAARRVGPASPSMLSSYATASAQPHLTSKFVPQVPQLGGPGGAYGDYRPPLRDDQARYAPADRPAAYPVQGSMRPIGGMGSMPPQQGHYGAPAPYVQNRSPAYGGAQPGLSNYYYSQPMAPVQPDFIFQVQFKRISKCFTNRSGYQIQERDFVVVEGDRGEDIGVVIAVLTMQEFVHRRMSDPRAAADNHTVDCILRLATMQERQQLPEKYNAEKNIVQSCNELAMHGFGLPIFVYDAEFQFDRNKLTIYYECNVRIDFRDFVRQLYSTYKARIWMKIGNINTPIDVQPLAVMALATGVHFSSGGAVA